MLNSDTVSPEWQSGRQKGI